jgi:WD40 repeat protein
VISVPFSYNMNGRTILTASNEYLVTYTCKTRYFEIRSVKTEEMLFCQIIREGRECTDLLLFETGPFLAISVGAGFEVLDLSTFDILVKKDCANHAWHLVHFELTRTEDLLIILDNLNYIHIYETSNFTLVNEYHDFRYRINAFTCIEDRITLGIEEIREHGAFPEYFLAQIEAKEPCASFRRFHKTWHNNIWKLTSNHKDLILTGFNDGKIRVFDKRLIHLHTFTDTTNVGFVWALEFMKKDNFFISVTGFKSMSFSINQWDRKSKKIVAERVIDPGAKITAIKAVSNTIYFETQATDPDQQEKWNLNVIRLEDAVYKCKDAFQDVLVKIMQ